jgi:hypothetical protein
MVVRGSGAMESEMMAINVLCNLCKMRRREVQGRTPHAMVESALAVTNNHLRFSCESIIAPYVGIVVFNTSAIAAFNVHFLVKPKGVVVLNCAWLKVAVVG